MTDQEIAEAPAPDTEEKPQSTDDNESSGVAAAADDVQATSEGVGEVGDAGDAENAGDAGDELIAGGVIGEEAVEEGIIGGGTIGEVKYDFTRPWTISNKFHQNLASIAEAFANQLSFSMSNYLRTSVDVSFDSVKQELFKDYLDRLPDQKCIGVFSFQPLGGQSVITVDGGVMFAILDKLIGGQGTPHEIGRDFTEIETRIFMLVTNKVLGDLREAARKFFESSVHLNRIENNPAFIAVMTGGEKVIVMTLDMKIGDHNGSVMVATPMSGFDPVMSALDPTDESLLDRTDIPVEDREKVYATLNESSVEVTAVIGCSMITLDRLLDLEVGDSVILSHRTNDPIAVKVGKKTVCKGQPGKSQNRKAVKIV